MNIRRFVSMLMLVVAFAPARVYADDEVIPPVQTPSGEADPGNVLVVTKKSAPAPFTGILLSPRAVAELLSKLEAAKKEADLAAARAREEQRTKDETEIKGLQIELGAEKRSAEERLAIRDNRISALEKDLVKSQEDKPNPVTWFAVGATSTALITLGIVLLAGGAR